MSLVEVDRVSKRFGARTVVDAVSFTVEQGQTLALLGPSGCGKTTLLRMIAGLEPPDGGRIRIGGELVSGDGAAVPPERRRIGFVFQSFALFPHLSVEENVGFGARGPVDTLLRQVHLVERRAARIDTLSGGEQQRVALARALAAAPRVVLLDEPFANLDAALRRAVRDELAAILRAAGATSVLVTHDAAEAYGMADRLVVLSEGRVLQSGTPEEIYAAPVSLEVARRTGEVVTLPGRTLAGGRVACALGELALARDLPAGREVTVALRPERLLLGERGAAATARVAGRVFEGATVCFRLELDGATLLARTTSARDHAVGAQLSVGVDGPVSAFLA
jgi:iron(III) transport system ATP-binding protein